MYRLQNERGGYGESPWIVTKKCRIDLHIHSNASDGTYTPYEIIKAAERLNLKAIAITDHDTLSGSIEAMEAGIPASMHFATGIEVSSSPPESIPCTGSFHILGYFIDVANPQLNKMLSVLQDARKNRNPKIIEKLNASGLDLSLEEIKSTYAGQIGRPHIARDMVRKGYAKSINEAFDIYLGKGKQAYVEKYRIGCREAIETIKQAGGIAVLAHPALIQFQNNDNMMDTLIRAMKDMGLGGIEAYYPEHSTEQIHSYIQLADRYDILVTGGTDFHGALKPDVEMGLGKGDFFVPYTLFQRLLDKMKY